MDCIGDCYSVSKHTGNQLLHTTVLRKHISRSRANYICATMKKRNFDLSTAAGSNAAFYRCISESQAKERLLVDKLTYFYIGYNALLTLCFLLFTLLCGLKFDNFISGSWWLIFLPVWIQFATFPILLYVIFWSLKYPNVYNATGAWGFLVRYLLFFNSLTNFFVY